MIINAFISSHLDYCNYPFSLFNCMLVRHPWIIYLQVAKNCNTAAGAK